MRMMETPFHVSRLAKRTFGIVVAAAAGDDGDVVSTSGKLYGQIGQMLARGNNIGIKTLIEKQDLHGVDLMEFSRPLENLGGKRREGLLGRVRHCGAGL